MAAIGVNLNVLGEENLTAQRPAVFIFNHRNKADPFIAGSAGQRQLHLGRQEGAGERPRRRAPSARSWTRPSSTATTRKAAVEGLQKVEELARKGLSILIAPEGTRLDTTEVGPFKKGPFRIAMAAGIPIVPIVIRNAEVIASRDSTHVQPGHRGCRCLPADFGRRLDVTTI